MARLRGALHDSVADAVASVKRRLFDGDEEAEREHDAEEREKYGGQFQIESISPQMVVIPATDVIEEVDVRYPLIEPFADAHVYWDGDEEKLVYAVDEPELSDRERRIFEEVKEALEEKIDVPMSELEGRDAVVDYLQGQLVQLTKELGYRLTDVERNKIMYYIYRNFAGLGAIEAIMHDPYIEDIGCSGVDIPVYIVHSKFGSIKTDLVFEEEDELKNLVVKLAERANKYVSYAEPLLDGTLPDGSRVNASLTTDVTTKGPTFSIRKFQEVPYSAVDLMELGTANAHIMAYMWLALEYQKSFLIIGGTATGKTTFLNSIVAFIPPEQKIVSIEDTRELQLPHENWIPAVTRTGVSQDNDQVDISMYQLLRESFRQNPDYVIVGETRGEEASVLFQGMASGHPSISTMHASSPYDVVSRLTTAPIDLSPSLVETLDFIVSVAHAREVGENARRVQAIFEIEDISAEGTPRTNEYVSWVAVDDSFSVKGDSTVLERIEQQYGVAEDELHNELEDRKTVLEWMHDNGFSHFTEVAQIVSEYYTDKQQVMDAIADDTSMGMGEVIGSGRHGRETTGDAGFAERDGDEPEAEPVFADVGPTETNPFADRADAAPDAAEAAAAPAPPDAPEPAPDEARADDEDVPEAAPERPETDAGAAETDYDDLVREHTIPEVQQAIAERGLDPGQVLCPEQRNQQRKTLIAWLEEEHGVTGDAAAPDADAEQESGEVDYDALVTDHTVPEVKERVVAEDLDPGHVFDAEQRHRDRSTLTSWLRERMDEEPSEDDAASTGVGASGEALFAGADDVSENPFE